MKRAEREDQAMAECTFTPIINEYCAQDMNNSQTASQMVKNVQSTNKIPSYFDQQDQMNFQNFDQNGEMDEDDENYAQEQQDYVQNINYYQKNQQFNQN